MVRFNFQVQISWFLRQNKYTAVRVNKKVIFYPLQCFQRRVSCFQSLIALITYFKGWRALTWIEVGALTSICGRVGHSPPVSSILLFNITIWCSRLIITMWAGPLIFSSTTNGDVWISPYFLIWGYVIMCACWARFMCHHKLLPTSESLL